jgi:DNA-binding transcriptional regulator LsrR (DeoR family)
VSKLYYEQLLTQQEISDKLGLSRPKISRLLKQARNEGIIKINVLPIVGVHTDLEDAVEQKYQLKEVVIVDVSESSSQNEISREIGTAAANYFCDVISDRSVIGISWGTTLQAMVDALPKMDLREMQIVQLIGGLGKPESEAHVNYILRRLFAQTRSKLSILNFPGIVDNVDVKTVVMTDSHVREVFNQYKKISIAFVGIGVPTPDSVVMRDGSILSQMELDTLLSRGAVADICLRFFNKEGIAISSDVNNRVVGITLEDLKQIHRIVGVAGGPAKEDGIRAALNGKLINVLITDQINAEKLYSS